MILMVASSDVIIMRPCNIVKANIVINLMP